MVAEAAPGREDMARAIYTRFRGFRKKTLIRKNSVGGFCIDPFRKLRTL